MPQPAARSATIAGSVPDRVQDDGAWVALHPMHQRLVAEFDTVGAASAMSTTPVKRMAGLFYIGLGGWAVVFAGGWGVATLF